MRRFWPDEWPVESHYPDFLAALVPRDRDLPTCVQEEFEAYRKCGRLDHGLLRAPCRNWEKKEPAEETV